MVEEKKVEEKKVEKESTDKYILKEVVTQTDTAIGKIDSEEVFTEKGLLVEILNKLERIEETLK